MTTWQRRTRVALGVFVVAFAVLVFLAIRRRPPDPRSTAPAPADPAATLESTRGSYQQSTGARDDFRIEYNRLLSYPDGRSKLFGVKVTVKEKDGRSFVITAQEADVGQNQSGYSLHGDVRLDAQDGLQVKTEEASYNETAGVVRASGPVSFSKGRLSGHGVGMTYDKPQDVISLLDQAVIHLAAESGAPGAEVTAATAAWARRDKYVRFERDARRDVRMTRDAETLEADIVTARLTDDENGLRLIETRGHSRIAGAPGAAGSLKAMRSRDMDLAYSGDGRTLQHATLVGDAAIEIAGESGTAGRRLAADWLALGLGADGVTLAELNGRDRVQFDLPAEAGAPARTIRGNTVQGAGPPGEGLTTVGFQGGAGEVEYSETRPAPADPRTARSRTLDLVMKPGLGTLDEARFSGGVQFTEGRTRGAARESRYMVANGVMELEGDQAGRPPLVILEQATIEATRITVALDGPKVVAVGSVRSVLLPARLDASRGSGSVRSQPLAPEQKAPGFLKQEEVTNATADELRYDAEAATAAYKGKPARLWQAETSVYGEEIVLDNRNGDLHATGSVVSTLFLDQTDARTRKTEKVRSVARARELLYEDAVRRATYTGSADLTGPQGNLTADRVMLYLAEGGGALERIEGYGKVTTTVQQPQKRHATGDVMRYFAADERYVMTGAPVRIVEECGETKGKTLTFFRSADRMIIDGNEQTRTQTKGGAKCGEPRFD